MDWFHCDSSGVSDRGPGAGCQADTRAERIDPVLRAAGWGTVEGSRVRREMICPGRIQAGGKRGKGLSCDYVLFHKGQKLAVLEAKRAGLSHREGVGQAKDYATRLGARFAYASNGLGWYGIDMATGAEGDMDLPFPTPDELWDKTCGGSDAADREQVVDRRNQVVCAPLDDRFGPHIADSGQRDELIFSGGVQVDQAGPCTAV